MGVKRKSERIKLIFKIAGANAPAANFPCTLRIEVKCATRDIKIRYGKIIFPKSTAKLNASLFSENPGANT